MFSVGQVALNSGDQPTYPSIQRAFSQKRATDCTDNTGRGLHGQQEAPDYTDNTGHRSHGQHGSVCRDGQCFPWPDRRTRASWKAFRGPVCPPLRGSTSLFVHPRGFSPKCVTDNTENFFKKRGNDGRLHGQHGSGVPGRPVFSVARSSHASQSRCFPWARFRCTTGSTNLYGRSEGLSRRRAPRITRTTRATDHTDNTAPCAGDGQGFRWPDRRTRASSSAFRGPGCRGSGDQTNLIVDPTRRFLTECTPGQRLDLDQVAKQRAAT